MNPIIEAMARAMQAHEWSGAPTGKAPKFEGDERQYWIACAKATYDAIIAAGYEITKKPEPLYRPLGELFTAS